MYGRMLSWVTFCAVSATCVLATVNTARGTEPQPIGLPAGQGAAEATLPAPEERVAPPPVVRSTVPPGTFDEPAHLRVDKGPSASARVYFSGEFLLWWFNDSPQPVPLVTAVQNTAANPNVVVGSLSDPNARVVLGSTDIGTDLHCGGRFTVGAWLDENQGVGIEASYLFVAPTRVSESVISTGAAGTPLLSVPFFDVTGFSTPNTLPGEGAGPIVSPQFFAFNFPAAIPGVTTGVFVQRLESRLQGAELNGVFARFAPLDSSRLRLTALGGFRYLNLRESLSFSSTIKAGPAGFPDVEFAALDQFTARNDFYGGQFGLRAEYVVNRLVLQATAKLALGGLHQQVTVNGSTSTNLIAGPGTPLLVYNGGIFAQPSNIGSHDQDCFAVLPELTLSLGYEATSWARLWLGYNFLYLHNAARPGAEINRQVNVTRIPFNTEPTGPALTPAGSAEPAFSFLNSDFWAQGISLGMELRY